MKSPIPLALLLCLTLTSPTFAVTDAQCNELLDKALDSHNPDTRKIAVAAYSLAAQREPMLTRLEGMMQDKDVEVRLAVVASLAEQKTRRGTEASRS